MLISTRGRRRRVAYDGLAFLSHFKVCDWNLEESKNFEIRSGLLGPCEGIFIKRGGITYFI